MTSAVVSSTNSFISVPAASCRNMPPNAGVTTPSAGAARQTSTPVTTSATSDSQCVTSRCDGFRNRSTSRIANTAPSRNSSGNTVARSAGLNWIMSVDLYLGHGELRHQVLHGRFHQVREGLGVHAQREYGDRERTEHDPFARIEV